MNLSTNTLTLMRHSAGAVIAAAAISGEACAESPVVATNPVVTASDVSSNFGSDMRMPNAEQPKKDGGEEKKEEKRDPCPPCGRG